MSHICLYETAIKKFFQVKKILDRDEKCNKICCGTDQSKKFSSFKI